MAGAVSAGTKGFLFCDLRGYTAFIERSGDAAAAELLATYREMVRGVIALHEGAEIRTEGDSVYVVFPAASGAVEAGLGIVAGAAERSTRERPIAVGVGVHAGETVATTEGLVGGAVNIAARVCAKAQAGEVLVTDTVRALTRTYLPYRYTSLGTQSLKGIAGGIPLYRVEAVPSSGRARLRRQLGARRGRLALLGGLVVVLLVAAGGAWAANRPADCLSLPADTKDVVARIDPARNCVVAVYPVGQEPGPIVVADDRVWVANVKDQTVQWIDPASGRSHTTSARGLVTEMVAAEDGIWTLDGHAGRLSKVPFASTKPFDGLVLPTTPPDTSLARTGGSFGGTEGLYNARYGDLVAGGGRLYVTSPKEGVVLRIDPRHEDVTNATKYPLERIPVVQPPEPSKDTDGSLRWAGTGIGTLGFGDGALWLADVGEPKLWRSEAGSPRLRSLATAATTGAVDLLPAFGAVWTSGSDGSLTRTDIATAQSRELKPGRRITYLAAGVDSVWAIDADANAVVRMDQEGSVARTIPLAGSPSHVAVGPEGSVWVTLQAP